MEPSAVMDVLGVHRDYRGRHVAAAVLDQLRTNLLGLGIRTLQTEVRWHSPDLLAFFQHECSHRSRRGFVWTSISLGPPY